jgi:hypothetical protein
MPHARAGKLYMFVPALWKVNVLAKLGIY